MKRKGSVCLKLCLVVLLYVSTGGCSGGYDQASGVYEGKGFTVGFPAGWKKGRNVPNATITVEDPGGSAQISLIVQDLPEDVTLEQYLDDIARKMGMIGARQNDSGTISIGGIEGVWTQRTITVGGAAFESLSYYVKHGGRVYAVLAIAKKDSFTSFEPVFDEVAKSLSFED